MQMVTVKYSLLPVEPTDVQQDCRVQDKEELPEARGLNVVAVV